MLDHVISEILAHLVQIAGYQPGREDEAARVLHALRDDHGPHALARVVQLRGPASPLAARLAPAGPYR